MARPSREELRKKVAALVEPLLASQGFELVEVEVVGQGGGTILRLFIDKPGGITLDDCADVSNVVSPMLDVEDPFESAYSLEVSSPGLDRPLRKPSDFLKFLGKQVRVKTYAPIDGGGARKMFVGELKAFAEETIKVDVDGTVFSVPLSAVAKANLEWTPDDDELEGDEA